MKKYLLFFCILPFLAASQSTRFMVASDTHIYSPTPDFKQTILYELTLAAINEQVDFIFLTGDLVIRGFSDPANQDSVFKDWRFVLDTLDQHGIRLYACRGNNDYNKAAWDSLFKGKYAFPQNGPENELNITYSFAVNNVLFIAMDQYTKLHRINQPWLDEILNNNDKPHIFAAGHEPAFKLLHTNSMGAYPAARDSMWESLLDAGAKIFFCGHDHFYDHSIIDDADDDLLNDMHQVISGTGSYPHGDADYDGDNGRWTPERLFHEQANGYVLVDIQDSNIKLTWKHRNEEGIYEKGGDNYSYIATAVHEENVMVSKYVLHENYPNPFNSTTNIEYTVRAYRDTPQHVTLSIHDILGKKVATLVDRKQPAGSYQVQWDAGSFASGIYYYRIEAGDFLQAKKMVLLK